MRRAALLLTTALAARALEPTQLWPTTQTCVSCRALGMGDYDGGAAIFVAPTTTSNTKVEALPVPVGADAAIAMELGADGVLLNTAVAEAEESLKMAEAMKLAVEAGRLAFEAGRMPRRRYASASSPLAGVVGT